MIPDIRLADVRRASRLLEEDRSLRRANDAVVEFMRRRHAVGTYTHVLDQWGIVYDQPLLLAIRQAGAAIEGAVRQSITHLERLAVDTHGYTDFGMAVGLQRAVECGSQRTASRYSIDALRSVGPVGHRHINFRGTYRFPVERYADRLVASAA